MIRKLRLLQSLANKFVYGLRYQTCNVTSLLMSQRVTRVEYKNRDLVAPFALLLSSARLNKLWKAAESAGKEKKRNPSFPSVRGPFVRPSEIDKSDSWVGRGAVCQIERVLYALCEL